MNDEEAPNPDCEPLRGKIQWLSDTSITSKTINTFKATKCI